MPAAECLERPGRTLADTQLLEKRVAWATCNAIPFKGPSATDLALAKAFKGLKAFSVSRAMQPQVLSEMTPVSITRPVTYTKITLDKPPSPSATIRARVLVCARHWAT